MWPKHNHGADVSQDGHALTDRTFRQRSPLRILQVHNTYQQAGGEDVVVENERELLTAHGHEVFQEMVHNDAIRGLAGKIAVAWRTPYSPAGRRRILAAIERHQPDVMHVHNFFPQLTPAIYDASTEAGIPAVQTLHNYRTICADAMLLRDGRPCEDCVGHSPYRSVLHKCYRDSRLGTLAVARMIAQSRPIWHTKVSRLIALTKFARHKFIEAGLPAERITVKPNFAPDPGDGFPNRSGALFVGRLSAEKGVETLLTAWRQLDLPLTMIGGGPLHDTVRSATLPHVAIKGQQPLSHVIHAMKSAAFLIFPSEWYEGQPMTVVQAFACGLPVIASRLGAMVELIEDGVTGLHINPKDPADLAAKVSWAGAHPREMREMGRKARLVFEKRYTEEANYPMLLSIYQNSIAELSGRKTSGS